MYFVCATKNLNSKKPWKKGKIIVFSFGMELLLVGTRSQRQFKKKVKDSRAMFKRGKQ